MRKLKIIEHISLDGVIQTSDEDGDFPCGDWYHPHSLQGRRTVEDRGDQRTKSLRSSLKAFYLPEEETSGTWFRRVSYRTRGIKKSHFFLSDKR